MTLQDFKILKRLGKCIYSVWSQFKPKNIPNFYQVKEPIAVCIQFCVLAMANNMH